MVPASANFLGVPKQVAGDPDLARGSVSCASNSLTLVCIVSGNAARADWIGNFLSFFFPVVAPSSLDC